jgi:hypothetical protein
VLVPRERRFPTRHGGLPREDLRDLLIAASVAALLSAREADSEIELTLTG